MTDGINRVFVGWDRPLLHSVRDYLLSDRGGPGVARFGAVRDLSAVTVILPGARAGRRLLELLAPAGEGAVVPPRILTLGSWLALGAPSGIGTAGEVARLAAWAGALRMLQPRERDTIAPFSDVGEAESPARWMGVARLLDACHAELSGERLRFEDVAVRGADAPDFSDAERWRSLAKVQEHYRALLRTADLVDVHLERLDRLERGEIDLAALAGAGGVVLAGITEMNRTARAVVSELADRCVALVAAPAAKSGSFDRYGCVISTAWEDEPLDIPDDGVIVAESPEGQAAAAWRVVESVANEAPGAVCADQITIGVPDAEVEERLRRLAGRLRTVPVRRAEGTPVVFTRPAKLLLAAADYVERRDFDAMAALVRHPDAERWIDGVVRSRGGRAHRDKWLRVLDEYQAEHLHGRVDGAWLTDDDDVRGTLEMLHRAITELLGAPDRGQPSLLDETRREPGAWCGLIWDVVRAAYSGWGIEGGSRKPQLDPATHEACMVIQADLQELASLPSTLGAELRLTPGEALRLTVHQVGDDAVPEHGENAAIDLVGWLELAADDAPWLIVTGMNEGRAPTSGGVDPLLPEGLRRALGLRNRRARAARDVHAAGVMLRSRAAGRCVFVFGRRSGEGDPLTPSRLLMMGDGASLLRRVGQWTGEVPSDESADGCPMLAHAEASGFDRSLPATIGDVPAIDEMSVSSFADYLASPLGFYLKHVLRLREVDDGGVELDALGFGTLIHDVLRKLSDAAIAGSRDEREIADFLTSHLESTAALLFGESPRAEVWVQLEQAKARLRAFAAKQAEWAAKGWRIVRTEWAPADRTAFLDVDDAPMYLRGRIDRVDVNEDGRWAVLDYKTSTKKVEQWDACSKQGRWINPQLPLYRHLAQGLREELALKGEPALGWISLPSRSADTEIVEARWSSEHLAAADEVLNEVVRNVRLGRFDDPGDAPPGDGILRVICGGFEREEGQE